MAEPVMPTPVEPHGIVVCTNDPEPHSLTGECVDPQPAEWTPGAAAALLRREQPQLAPDLTDEDVRKADEIIAQAEGFVVPAREARRADVRAAYERGKAEGISEGRRQADNAINWGTSCLGCADKLDGLIEERGRGYDEGLAEGRRQATEGWERQVAIEMIDGPPYPVDDEDHARWHVDRGYTTGVLYRLVGPWEPVPDPPNLLLTEEEAGQPTEPPAPTRCSKCFTLLQPCATCGKPAQCGDVLCAACTPAEQPEDGTR